LFVVKIRLSLIDTIGIRPHDRFRLCNDNDASDFLDDYNVCYVLDGINDSDFLDDINVSDVPALDDHDAYDIPDGIDDCDVLDGFEL
jgi:hypothetical protein